MQNVAGRFSAVNNLLAILNAATVNGVRHGHFHRTNHLSSALVHTAAVFHALRCQPQTRLMDGHHGRLEFLGERNGVVDVIEVPVRNQKGVDTVEFMPRRIFGIAVHPGIHHQTLPGIQPKLNSAVP